MVVLLGLALAPYPVSAQPAATGGGTKLLIQNFSNADVIVMVQTPGSANLQDGCTTDINDLRALPLRPTLTAAQDNSAKLTGFPTGSTSSGWFTLKKGKIVELVNTKVNPFTGQPNNCLQGLVIGFGQFGNSCPGDTLACVPAFPDPSTNQPVNPPVLLPNGSNSFEPTLNLPGTINNAFVGGNEAFDTSCVNGANCTLRAVVTPPKGGPFWNVNQGTLNKCGGVITYKSTATSQNSWVNIAGQCDDNCVDPKTGCPRPGIQPYGCTLCNVNPDPGSPCTNTGCSGPKAQFCAVNNGQPANTGCSFNRTPIVSGTTQTFGGTIVLQYLGPLSPPAGSCNGGAI